MTRTKMAAAVAALTLSAGAFVPATGVAAKHRRAASSTSTGLPLADVCKALGLDTLLSDVDANLAPLVRLKLYGICVG